MATSVSQIVEQIIESLSESISQLMMLVIVLQERNADPPPQLPGGVQVVTGSAETLQAVAQQLAEDEYGEYPDIKAQILEAAAAVGESVALLRTAMHHLGTSPDRAGAWDNLVKACKTMSAKTIQLLQIVYGAERERVFRAAQRALEALRGINPDAAASDPKNFAAQVSEAATKAAQLAAFVKGKAEETESPEQKAALQQQAAKLQEHSRVLVEDANALLRTPHDQALKERVAGDLDDLRSTIDDTTRLLHDMDHEFDDAHDRFLDSSADIERSLAELEAGGLDSYGEDILLTAKRERQGMDDLLDDLDRDDAAAAQEALAYAAGQNQKLAKLAEMEARVLPAGETAKRQELAACQRGLEECFPAYEQAARRAIAAPDDDAAQDGLDAAQDRLDAAIQRLCDLVSTPNNEIGAAARKEVEDLAKMREAGAGGDANGVSRAAKAVVKENKLLCDVCTGQADRCAEADPERQRMILDNVDELQRLLPHQILAAKRALEQPSPASLAALNASTDTMTEQVRATAEVSKSYPELDLLEAAAREKRFLDNLQQAAQAGNGARVAGVAPELADNTALVGALARDIARKKDRARQAQILESVVALEKLQAPTAADARALAANPGDARLRQKLQAETAQMKELVDRIVDDCDAELFRQALLERGDLHNMKNSLDVGDPAGLADATKATVRDQARLVPLARAAAKRTEDPVRRKQMLDDVDELERLLPHTVASTNRVLAAPDDEQAKEALRQSVHTTRQLLQGITDAAEYDPSVARGAAAGGDPEAARLKAMMPALMEAAERAARNPHDRLAQQRLQDLLDSLPLDALDSDAQRLARLLREADDALTRMTDAADRGDRAGTDAAAADAGRLVDQAKAQARKLAAKAGDADLAATVESACQALDSLMPRAVQAARAVAQAPQDELARRRMYEAVGDVREQLALLGQAAVGTNETRLRAAAAAEQEALRRLRAAVKAGDQPSTRAALADVKAANARLCDESRTAAGGVRDPAAHRRVLDAVTELEQLMPVLDADCRAGAAAPADAAKQAAAMRDIDRAEALVDQLLQDTRADAVGLAQLEDRLLTQLQAHLKAADPAAAKDVQQLVATQGQLKAAAAREMQRMTNPRAKQNVQQALAELDRLLPLHIECGKAVLQRPGDAAARRRLEASTDAMRAPLAQLIATMKPNAANVAAANAAREKALLAQLRQACGAGNRQECERLLPEVAAMNGRLVKLAATEADNARRPPEVRQTLREAGAALDRLHGQLPALARQAAQAPRDQALQARLAAHTAQMEAQMDRIVAALRQEEGRSAKARRLANALMRMSRSGQVDSDKFLAAARALAGYIDSLVTGDASLEEQLALLQKRSAAARPLGRQRADGAMDAALAQLKHCKPPARQQPQQQQQRPPRAEPKTFDERIQAVAEDISFAAEGGDDSDPVVRLTRKIAAELSRMAQAAKGGQRQQMVQASRDATQTINELCGQHLRPLAARCRDAKTRDKLNRAAQAMKNYSVQMKILAAVKAGSGSDTDADTEDQLVSVTRSVGNCITESVNSVTTMRNGRLLRP